MSPEDQKWLLHKLRTCRTFSYPEWMAKAADEIERLNEKVEILEAELRVTKALPGEIDRRMSKQGL